METKIMQVYYDSSAYPFKDQARETRYPVIGTSFTGASNTTRIRFYVNQFANIGTCTFVAITKLPSGKKLYEQLSKDTTSDTEPFVYLDISSAYTQEKGDIQIALNVYEGGVNIVVDSESGLYSVSGSPIITATGNIKISVAYTPYMDTNYGSVPTISVQQALALVSGKLDETSAIVVVDNKNNISASVFTNGQMVYDKSTDVFYQVVSGSYAKQTLVDIAYEYSPSGSDIILTIKLSDGLGVYKTLTINLTTYLASLTYVNAHINNKNNPHEVTKAQVGLGNVVNTSDSDTPLQNGTTKFTTGGAYNLQQTLQTAISTLNTTLKTYGKSLTIDETDFKLRLLDENGNTLSTIDLPLEELIVDGDFDSETQTIILTLFNGNTIEIPVADLISGLVSTDDLASVLESYYTITQVDTLLNAKADKSTTLSGYGITNAYTKTETDDLLEKKANVDGNYPTLTSGLADNLTPYSEDSGATQTNPFISNGTGTNNNTEIVTVGDYGLFKEKQGNTLVVNQLVQNGNFADTSNWTLAGQTTLSVSNNVAVLSASNGSITLYQDIGDVVAGHKYLFVASLKANELLGSNQFWLRCQNNGNNDIYGTDNTNWQTLRYILTATSGTSTIMIRANNVSTTFNVKNIFVIDLTQMFNGDIPQDLLDNPSHFSWYYNGDLSYNTGSLVNANGVKLVSTGRNIYNQNETYNLVIPNKPFFASKTTTITYYDKDKNVISTESVSAGNTFTTPSNCVFISSSVSAITITPYYTEQQGGEGYKDNNNTPIEYPYEEPYVVDTGNEVLRKAGSVKDYKEPNGTIHRLVKNDTLNNLSGWIYSSSNTNFEITLDNAKPYLSASGNKANYTIDKYTQVSYNVFFGGTNPDKVFCTFNKVLYVRDTSLGSSTTSFTGSINYELETPTTEQGTPFAENLPINDYGMLYWLDSSNNLVGIPQGAKIFYPTNYKGFVDDMYSRVDGDSSDYVVHSELSASETQRDTIDTQLKNAIGGTLRQCLCVKESLDFDNTSFVDLGTLDWIRYHDTTNNFYYFYSDNISNRATNLKVMCSKYQTVIPDGLITNTHSVSASSNSIRVYVRDDTYTDATTFKNAMKGVLLAYEKA